MDREPVSGQVERPKPAGHPPGLPGSTEAWPRQGPSPPRLRPGRRERYRGRMIEVVGDSSRDAEWACVRLGSTGDRIVEAEAEGLERPLEGLTLLEAARRQRRAARRRRARRRARTACSGRRPTRERVAVAMSGGVDSAVALLRAGPKAVGVTLRLWLDPKGPGLRARLLLARGRRRRPRDLPWAGPAARHPRPARGVPGERRRARSSRATRAGRRRIPASAATARSASTSCWRSRAGPGARGSRPATTRGSSSATAGCCSLGRPTATRTSRTCSPRLDPRHLPRLWFPLGDQGKDETRAEAARGRTGAPPTRAESQEACFLAGDDYRTFLERHGLDSSEGPVVDTAGRELGRHAGFWRLHARPAQGDRRGHGDPALRRCGPSPRTNTVVVGPREALACTRVRARGRLYAPVERVEAKLRYRSPAIPADVEPSARGFGLRARRAGLRRREGAGGGAVRRRRRRRHGPGLRYRLPLRERARSG